MAGFLRLLKQKYNPPGETSETFSGKNVLITGTTSGLGLEAAKKLAVLDASKLIITARTVKKGEEAKASIQQHIRERIRKTNARSAPKPDIVVLPLDMSSMSNVQAFSSTLEDCLGNSSLDAVILNAATNQRTYSISPDGYEETLQVNVISTSLLAMLVLPLLISASETKGHPSHLTFVSSGLANTVSTKAMTPYLSSTKPLKSMSLESNFPLGKFGGNVQYGRSKLMLEYAMRHIATLPAITTESSQEPKVIVNSTCPGMCRSGLGRQYVGSILAKVFIWIFYTVFARSAEQGANSYISALTRGPDGHGVMWKDDKFYQAGEMIRSVEGKNFGKLVWRELEDILEAQELEAELLT